MIKWKYNERIDMDLPEATLKAFDEFIKQPYFKLFVPEDCIKKMRDKFKKDFNLEDC